MPKTRPRTRINELRHKISIQSLSSTEDSDGNETGSWAEISGGDVYAKVEAAGGGEVWRAGQRMPECDYIITIRSRSDLGQEMRIVTTIDSIQHTLKIEGIRQKEGMRLRGSMELFCKEIPSVF